MILEDHCPVMESPPFAGMKSIPGSAHQRHCQHHHHAHHAGEAEDHEGASNPLCPHPVEEHLEEMKGEPARTPSLGHPLPDMKSLMVEGADLSPPPIFRTESQVEVPPPKPRLKSSFPPRAPPAC